MDDGMEEGKYMLVIVKLAPRSHIVIVMGASRYDVCIGEGEGGHEKADVVREVM